LHVSSFDATALAYAETGFDLHFLLTLAGTQQSWFFCCGVNIVTQ